MIYIEQAELVFESYDYNWLLNIDVTADRNRLIYKSSCATLAIIARVRSIISFVFDI